MSQKKYLKDNIYRNETTMLKITFLFCFPLKEFIFLLSPRYFLLILLSCCSLFIMPPCFHEIHLVKDRPWTLFCYMAHLIAKSCGASKFIFHWSFSLNIEKQPPELFLRKNVLRNFSKFAGKQLCQSLFFYSFTKKRLWHRCFPVNLAKFLRTPFLQNTSGCLSCNQGFFCFFQTIFDILVISITNAPCNIDGMAILWGWRNLISLFDFDRALPQMLLTANVNSLDIIWSGLTITEFIYY